MGDLDSATLSMRLHAAGNIHRVAPHIVNEFSAAYRTLDLASVFCHVARSFTLECLKLCDIQILEPEAYDKYQSSIHDLELCDVERTPAVSPLAALPCRTRR